jgi:RNA 2',3'-cyclic 3'-phosphodiesterase
VPPAPTSPADTLRLFVALWPDAAAHAWLRACDAAIVWPAGAVRAGPERWHMTLHFLGAVPRAQLTELLAALQHPFDPFAIEFGRVEAWPRGLVVVQPTDAVPALQHLQAALGQALQRAGQRVEARAFKPHVTLARRAARAGLAAPSPPQRWPVSAYALVASAGGRYRNVALYPGGVLSPTADASPATTQTRPARRPMPR